jgi:biopolymer transport protein ExbD
MIASTTIVSTYALDLVLPKSSGSSDEVKNVSVSVNSKQEYFIDTKQVDESALENELITLLKGQESPAVMLHVEQGVPIERAVSVMDIAYRNNFKVVLAVDPK